jgi:hypothetical protein
MKKDFDFTQTKAHIAKYGLSVIKVPSSTYLPSFAHSVGLFETYNHPEIICFGLHIELLHELINDVAHLIQKEGDINLLREYDYIFENSRAKFLRVDPRNIKNYFGVAMAYYDYTEFEALQLVWTDRNDTFPWEAGFEEEFRHKQPLLDRNADFKFREEKNRHVFTTRQWLEANEPIVRVVHDEDGDWQFFTEEVDFEHGKVVSLAQMVERDKTLNEVFDLDYGQVATRDYIGAPWKREKL